MSLKIKNKIIFGKRTEQIHETDLYQTNILYKNANYFKIQPQVITITIPIIWFENYIIIYSFVTFPLAGMASIYKLLHMFLYRQVCRVRLLHYRCFKTCRNPTYLLPRTYVFYSLKTLMVRLFFYFLI